VNSRKTKAGGMRVQARNNKRIIDCARTREGGFPRYLIEKNQEDGIQKRKRYEMFGTKNERQVGGLGVE